MIIMISSKSPWSIIILTSFFLSFITFILVKFLSLQNIYLIELSIILLTSSILMLINAIYMGLRSVYGSIFLFISLGILFWFIGFIGRSYLLSYGRYIFPITFDAFIFSGTIFFLLVFVFFTIYLRKMLTATIERNISILILISLFSGIFYAFIIASYMILYIQGNVNFSIFTYATINILLDLITTTSYILLVFAASEGVINHIIRSVSFGLILVSAADYIFIYIDLGKLYFLKDFPFPLYGWAYIIFLLAGVYLLLIQTGRRV